MPVRPLDRAPIGPAYRVKPVRVGLYKPWIASMDEGWTRFLLERYGFRFENLSNEQMKAGAFRGKQDVILLPAMSKDILEKGEDFPQAFSCGNAFLYIPLRSRDAVRRARLRIDLWEDLLSEGWASKIYLIARDPELSGSHLRARMFSPAIGETDMVEDRQSYRMALVASGKMKPSSAKP